MRIAILASAMDAGGAERVAINLAHQFADDGHSVDLVLVRAQGELLRDIPPAVNIIGLGASRARTAIFGLRRYLKAKRPDALLAINFDVNLTAAIANATLNYPIPYALSVHMPVEGWLSGFSTFERKAMSAVGRWAYSRGQPIIAVSQGVGLDLVQRGWASSDQVEVIHNPILSSRLQALALEPHGHPWLGDPDVPCLVTVGRLTRLKNHALLITAFERMRRARPARLLIVGEGECRDELEGQVARLGLSQIVCLLGQVPNPYPIMRAADLFVLSSDYEGFGNVLVEAMAVGTPIVATDCNHGPREILEGGRWGRLVPPGDVEALAAAMQAGLQDARGLALERASHFTVALKAKEYLRIIRDIAKDDTARA